MTLLLAGHEAKVMEELDTVFSGGPLSADRVSKLEYLDAVIKETHRFRPIMPIGGSRRVKAPFAVGSYMIPPRGDAEQLHVSLAPSP